jgi:hypothetical protein
VPAGLNLRSIIVVLGEVDPAGSKGQFFEVLVEFVAGAICADELTVLGITCAEVRTVSRGRRDSLWTKMGIPMYCSRRSRELCVSQESSEKLEVRISGDVPASGGSNPVREMSAVSTIGERSRETYLDANLAQVAQGPRDGRHGGGSGQFLPVMGAAGSSLEALCGSEVIEAG